MNSINLDIISEIGGIFNVDGVIQNIFKNVETKLEYIQTSFKVSHLSSQILEELGFFLSNIKDVKAYLKLPVILSMPGNISNIIQTIYNFFESARCSDVESALNSCFNLFANSVDFMGEIKALSNSLNQLLKVSDILKFSGVTAILYPLSLIAIIIGILIKIKDYMQVKLMMRADAAVICYSKLNDKELKQFIVLLLEKRLALTTNEKLSIDTETDLVERIKKHDDLMSQKKAKYNRLVGNYAQRQLEELSDYINGNKRYSSTKSRKILSKISKIYEYESSAKIKIVVRNVFIIISTLFLTQGALLIPGCLVLIAISLSAIYDFIKNKNFYNELKSS